MSEADEHKPKAAADEAIEPELRRIVDEVAHTPNWRLPVLIAFLGLLLSIGLIVAGYKAGAFRRWLGPSEKPRKTAAFHLTLSLPTPGSDKGPATTAYAIRHIRLIASTLNVSNSR